MRKPSGRSLAISLAVGLCFAAVGCWTLFGRLQQKEAHSDTGPDDQQQPTIIQTAAETSTAKNAGQKLEEIPFDGQRAFGYLEQLCELGPRMTGSPGMVKQRELLVKHFEDLGGKVRQQKFVVRHPRDGRPTEAVNLVVTWHADKKERVLLCAHYDTRPLPDRDPDPKARESGTFIGANDGGSGTALLMEMAHYMKAFEGRYGVDFLLVDAEEFLYGQSQQQHGTDPRYFLGSKYFSRQHRTNPPAHTYRWGVVLDMVADRDLQLYYERNSFRWKDTRPLVKDIWATARRLGVKEFIARRKHTVRDDHVPLHNVARIPTCDIIDFDFGRGNRYWHTQEDVPEKCSALSLAKVGWVVHEWLKTAK